MRCKDGSWKWFYDRGKVVSRDTSGKPLRLIGIVFDITPRKQSEIALKDSRTKLQAANEAKDKLFSIIAHDLKNPFNALINLTDIMATEFNNLSEAECLEYIQLANYAAKNAYSLLENLLDWARTQTGDLRWLPQKIDYNEILDKTIALLNEQARTKGVDLLYKKALQQNYIYADSNMLKTVFRNLVSNAIKFTPKGGQVQIELEQDDDYLYTLIQDTGIGMDEETLRKLFQVGEKVNRPGTAGESGTGLGLVLCQEFVHKHGGQLHANSTKNKGTTFRLTIPKKQKAQVAEGY
jgi:signal transduction histidine kinase